MTSDFYNQQIQLPNWLDNNFLETILKSDDDSNLKVISRDVLPVTSVGDNYTSDIYRMIVKTRRANREEETALIIKIARGGEDHTEESLEGSLFQRENLMYGSTLPYFQQILNESSGCTTPTNSFFPKCIYTQIEPTTAMILEDLKGLNFQMVERGKALDLNHCSLVIKKLAEFHAASVALKKEYPDSLDHYQKSVYCEEMRQNYEPFFVGTMKALVQEVKTWPEYCDTVIEKLIHLADTAADRVIEILKPNFSAFTVLNHGDLWSNNIMFKYSESSEITDLRFLDYQQCHLGSPALDILFFLFTNPNTYLWDNPDILLKEYHLELSRIMKRMNLKPPSLVELNDHFNEKALYGVVTACVVLPLVLADRKAMSQIKEIMDMEELSCSEYSVHLSDEYISAMKKLLLMFDLKGWL